MTPDPYVGATDDAAESSFAREMRTPTISASPVVLSAKEADAIAAALRQADLALGASAMLKLRSIREPAREARIKVQAAWATLSRPRAAAEVRR